MCNMGVDELIPESVVYRKIADLFKDIPVIRKVMFKIRKTQLQFIQVTSFCINIFNQNCIFVLLFSAISKFQKANCQIIR